MINDEDYSYACFYAYELTQRYPEAPTGYFLLARARQLSGYYEPAIKAYNDCIKVDKTYYPAYINLGLIKYEQKEYKQAIKQYNKVIKSKGYYKEKAIAYFNRAAVKHKLKNTNGALKDLEKVLIYDSNFPKTYNSYYYTRGLYKYSLFYV